MKMQQLSVQNEERDNRVLITSAVTKCLNKVLTRAMQEQHIYCKRLRLLCLTVVVFSA